MVTCTAKFTPHFSSLIHALRQLLKKYYAWIYDTNTQRDFELKEKTVVQVPCLRYFDEKKSVTLFVDASKNEIAAVLLQEGQPVAFGSVSLTETQKQYAHIQNSY